MLVPFRMWLKDIPFTDSLRREQAVLLQAFLFILTAAAIVGALATLTAASINDRLIGVSSSLLLGLMLIGAVVVLRRGHFTRAVVLVIVSMIMMVVVNMIPTGLQGSRAVFTLLALPIVLAGLLGGRRLLLLAFILSVLAVIGVTVLEVATPTLVGYSEQTYDPVLTCVTFVVAAGVLALLIGRFGQALQRALWQARSREQELDALRISLEQQVDTRTTELRQALQDVEQREATLTQTLAELRASEAAVRELSAPVIPLLPGVLAAPLIGALDSARAKVLTENVLAAIERTGAHHVIFDITGVPVVDTNVARVLLNTAAAARLLGTSAALVGVRPEVAETIITLGIDFEAIARYPTLQEAVVVLLAQRHGYAGARMPQAGMFPRGGS
jgi:rsbT co-antagonist protein RsbR